LVAHPKVAEAAVVGVSHEIKGEGIYAYVTLNGDVDISGDKAAYIKTELKAWVRTQIGAIAMPDYIQFAPQLPKTRSGKIMRRILRKIAVGEFENLGDISTLLNPEAVENLIGGRG
jgi:acetyl-CoA synthetase